MVDDDDDDDGFDDDDLDVVVDGLTRSVLVQCLVLALNNNAMITMPLALVFPRNLAGSPINRASYSTASFSAIASGNRLLCAIQFRGEDRIWMYSVYPKILIADIAFNFFKCSDVFLFSPLWM